MENVGSPSASSGVTRDKCREECRLEGVATATAVGESGVDRDGDDHDDDCFLSFGLVLSWILDGSGE